MDAEAHAGRLPPPWLGNLLVFALLTAMAVAWFFHQTRQAQQAFLADTAAHARLLGDAVGLHARGAVLAQDVTDAMLTAFLGSSARFVAYLEGIEPFRSHELATFAAQAGLAVIRLVRDGRVVQGPADWHPGAPLGCSELNRLIRLPTAHAVLFGIARSNGPGCILVGMDSRRLETLRAAVGLPQALRGVRALPGVVAVALEGKPDPALARDDGADTPKVDVHRLPNGRSVAEARVAVAGAVLVVDMDAGPLLRERTRLWWEFAGFVLALTLAGGLGTWLLYRHQQAHDRRLRAYERQLSQQREEAGLGRAAAAIAHEIRNPLNAVAMGLQRLRMEANELEDGHRRLLAVVLEAVRRTDGSIAGLLDYTRPLRPRLEPVDLERLLEERCSLYRQRLDELDVEPRKAFTPGARIHGDPDLLRRVLDNLLRNAVEALPSGGVLEIALAPEGNGVLLAIANDGLVLAAGEVERILEPWFTTKTQGTGLGLAISRRIVEAHGGRLTLEVSGPGRLRVRVWLPVASGAWTNH